MLEINSNHLHQNSIHLLVSRHLSASNIVKLKPRTQVFFLLVGIFSAFTMSSIIQRLFRPFSSTTMRFTPDQAAQNMNIPEGAQKATIAAGCFWGIEHLYRKDFGNKGLLDARVGYIGGDVDNPTYRAVCSGRTGRKSSMGT